TEYGASCKDCHHATTAPPVKTPHNHYFKDSGIACQQCHGKKPSEPKQEACRKCHYDYSKSKGCSDKTPSPRLAIHKACWKCHTEGKGEKASKGCLECHNGRKKAW
ncbi:MAG: cytochrome c3 family protein, partial [Deltaproteobacteria bacterium]|nr:cytochrome c3 family protein [Deltaproteobacteria bacterium]